MTASAGHVFTYGTLMFGEVWHRVVSGEYEAVRGWIRGYARYRIRGELHPALLQDAEAPPLEGVVYLDVGPDDLAALDRFETAAYRRRRVAVELEGRDRASAWVYVFVDPSWVERTAWDSARFQAEGLAEFLRNHG
jgi:gamma-glutamylcyclotransferase (GGCT)/AIG2-like uncharacterized protein YtfP